MKVYYNSKYKALYIKSEEEIFLSLHYDYTLRDLRNKKISSQRAKLFKIIKKVNKLTYKLQLSSLIKIYSIISITQLKSISSRSNSYQRSRNAF